MCTFSIQMSEFLYFSCLGVKIWWFSSFSKTFRKIEEIDVFPHRGPRDLFGSIHTCVHFPSKWMNFYILDVLEWKYDDFRHFRKLWKNQKNWSFRPGTPRDFFGSIHICAHFHPNERFFRCPGVKIWWFSSFSENFWQIKRIEVFAHHRPGDLFGSVHTGANFLSKWVNFYIFIVLEWKRDDFLHFGKQLKKSKKLKFSPIADLRTSLAQFTHVYIFLKMSEFLYFICPWVEIWLLS